GGSPSGLTISLAAPKRLTRRLCPHTPGDKPRPGLGDLGHDKNNSPRQTLFQVLEVVRAGRSADDQSTR
ncbi:MAG TPA: hypothetical protein PK156_47780, partial [Polyangium sp.]|nr:hypothetical protein [Polyangium sp.]